MATKARTLTKQISAKPDCARLAELRSRVTTDQRKLLDQFWQEAKATDQWPICRVVHSQLRKAKVKVLLNPLGGDVVYERDGQSEGSCYALTLLGVLLTSEGEEHLKMLLDCIGFMQRRFLDEPKQRRFKDMAVVASLGWSELQRESMARLCRLSLIPWAGSIGNDSWELRAPDEVEDWEPSQTFETILDSALFRYFRADRAVLAEDRRKQDAANSQPFGHSPFGWSPWEGLRQSPPANPTPPAIDPLKRRYQVFVSSTFEDLKEERQHVMQALLESKCIPTGMELFPATSAEQWELIKRVIDECDYYMVIVAGRYGSIGKTGVGYTEMEFDYATQSGKPVIGFYHQNPELLVGAKLEKNDRGQALLKAFVEKVKRKLCRPYNTPADLGSAVKSAIFHELEFTPRPGWVRADAVPTSDTVERLKRKRSARHLCSAIA